MPPESLFRVLNGLRYFGVGAAVTRNIYKFPESYWVITRVKLSKDQNHGKAYGRLVWRGRARAKEEKIGASFKKQWELVKLPNYQKFVAKPEQIAEILPKSTEYTV